MDPSTDMIGTMRPMDPANPATWPALMTFEEVGYVNDYSPQTARRKAARGEFGELVGGKGSRRVSKYRMLGIPIPTGTGTERDDAPDCPHTTPPDQE